METKDRQQLMEWEKSTHLNPDYYDPEIYPQGKFTAFQIGLVNLDGRVYAVVLCYEQGRIFRIPFRLFVDCCGGREKAKSAIENQTQFIVKFKDSFRNGNIPCKKHYLEFA